MHGLSIEKHANHDNIPVNVFISTYKRYYAREKSHKCSNLRQLGMYKKRKKSRVLRPMLTVKRFLIVKRNPYNIGNIKTVRNIETCNLLWGRKRANTHQKENGTMKELEKMLKEYPESALNVLENDVLELMDTYRAGCHEFYTDCINTPYWIFWDKVREIIANARYKQVVETYTENIIEYMDFNMIQNVAEIARRENKEFFTVNPLNKKRTTPKQQEKR